MKASRHLILWMLCALACGLPLSPAFAQQEEPGYASLWVDRTAAITPEALSTTIAEVRAQQADPEYIFVMVHGFNVARESSAREFHDLAGLLKTETEKAGVRAAFVGLQWQSEAEGSVFAMEDAYFQTIPLARTIGRGAARQLLLGLHEAFPQARLTVLGHSMGCELSLAAVLPDIAYTDNLPTGEAFAPERDVKLTGLVLCGSDLDYDIMAKSGLSARDTDPRLKMVWATIAPYRGKGDKVLSLRARVRGRAGGMSFPQMTEQQIDTLLPRHLFIFDGEDIPYSHDFQEYYDAERLARLMPNLLYAGGTVSKAPPEMAEVEAILQAPNDVNALLPYLDSKSAGSMFYALWRIEKLNCGDARHMTDGTLEEIGRLLRDKPQMVWREQAKSPCVTCQKGQFPTVKALTRAGAPPRARR